MKVAALLFLSAVQPVVGASVVYQVPGQYPTIQSAIEAVPRGEAGVRHKIRIAPGVYDGPFKVAEQKTNIVLMPAAGVTDPGQVVLRAGPGQITLRVYSDDVTIKNLTIEQTAGVADGAQEAVEIRGSRVRFMNTTIKGNQDTLFIYGPLSQTYFWECEISGTVDFIFGDGPAYFDQCRIVQRVNALNPGGGGVATAPSTAAESAYGFVFNHCTFTREAGVPDASAQLYRPWEPYGSAAFVDCTLDKQIDAVAWRDWDDAVDDFDSDDVTFRGYEFASRTADDPPVLIDLSTRPAWVQTDFDPAFFSKEKVLAGWDP